MHTLRAPSQNVLPSSYFESAAPPAGWVVGAASRGNRLTRAKWQCQNSSAGDHWTACALLGFTAGPICLPCFCRTVQGRRGRVALQMPGTGPSFRHGGKGHGSWKSWKGKDKKFWGPIACWRFFLGTGGISCSRTSLPGFENTTIPFNWACLIHTTSGIIWPSRMGDFDRRSLPLHFSRHSFFDDRFCLLLERSTTATADPCRS